MMKNIFFIAIIFFICFTTHAQTNPAEVRARAELDRRGLDEEEVRNRLSAKGINLDNIDPSDAASVFKAQQALEEVLREIEAEKLKTSSTDTTTSLDTLIEEDKKVIAKKSEEVSKSVEEGATLEEAVSETLIDNQTEKLPSATVYGQEIFRSQSIKFYRQSKDVKAPNSYVLGVGDVVGISIWGASEDSNIFEVNEDGYIKPRGIPRIYLKGLKYGEAKKLLLQRFSNYYSFNSNQFEVSLNFSRTINVSIVGEVFNFGSFNIPAINTAFNALVAAGGPNDIGSVRKIQLIRPGSEVKTIDIYKYLNNPSISQDFYLEENDVIFVPVSEKTVTISGAVKRPMSYELLSNEKLSDLINYARGLKPNAIKKNVQIFRFQNDEEIVIDINWAELQKARKDFELFPGDKVVIKEISSSFDNYVQIGGAIETPGTYAFVAGDRLTDVFSKTTFKKTALLDLAYLQRLNDDGKTISYIPINLKEAINDPSSEANILLMPFDKISIINKSNLIDNSFFIVQGSVRRPDTFTYDYKKTIRISDALFLSNGLLPDASDFGFIQRVDSTNIKQSIYIRVNLKAIEENPESEENIYLEAKDKLIVYSKRDYLDDMYISISGEVRSPGVFSYDESLTLEDVVRLAKGLSYTAANNRIDLYRLDIGDNKKTKIIVASISVDDDMNAIGENIQLQPFDEIIVRRAPEFELPRKVNIRGEVKYPGEYVLIKDNETFTDIIRRAGGLTEEAFVEGINLYRALDGKGFVVSDYEEALSNAYSYNDIVLSNRDDIIIPKIENLITIIGETKAGLYYEAQGGKKLNVPYEKGKNAIYYVNKYAGGVNDNGSKTNITVRSLNGKISRTKKFLLWKSYPDVEKGSVITVNAKPIKIKKNKDDKEVDWSSIVNNTIAQATAILTVLLLASNI